MHWLASVGTINLIDVLTYYLILTLIVGTAVRLRNYLALGGFIYRFPDRWPKLLALVKHHKAIFLRWPTVLPIGLTLVLTLANALASRLAWSHAKVSVEDLCGRWVMLLAVVVSGGLMGFLDFRAMFFFGRFDRAALEANLDRAEHWLQTWKAPALRVLSFGFINPRKVVNEHVQTARSMPIWP